MNCYWYYTTSGIWDGENVNLWVAKMLTLVAKMLTLINNPNHYCFNGCFIKHGEGFKYMFTNCN